MSIITSNLTKLTDKLLNDQSKFDQLRAIANRKNYPNKVQQLTSKIQEQYEFFLKKTPTPRLLDLKRDLDFILTQTNSEFNKEKIDNLVAKYL